MVGMKCSYYSKIYETAREMTKHLSICRVQQKIAHYTILFQIQRRINDFFTIFKAKAILPLAEQMEGIYSDKEEKSPYTNNIKRIDPDNTTEYVEKADGKQVNPESVCNTCILSRLGIQST